MEAMTPVIEGIGQEQKTEYDKSDKIFTVHEFKWSHCFYMYMTIQKQ